MTGIAIIINAVNNAVGTLSFLYQTYDLGSIAVLTGSPHLFTGLGKLRRGGRRFVVLLLYLLLFCWWGAILLLILLKLLLEFLDLL
jgi:hypothetical protein